MPRLMPHSGAGGGAPGGGGAGAAGGCAPRERATQSIADGVRFGPSRWSSRANTSE
jgi:hypothetical protein